MQLYDYQLDLIDQVRAAWSAGKSAVCVKQIWDEASKFDSGSWIWKTKGVGEGKTSLVFEEENWVEV